MRSASPTPLANPAATARQHGSGAPGFLLAAVPVLLLGVGGIEGAHWMALRQTLSLALLEAGRAGATESANPQAILSTFEQALRMNFPDATARQRVLREQARTLGIPWQIDILSPHPTAFRDHADAGLRSRDDPADRLYIRNEGQQRQDRQRRQRGWRAGRGPVSGQTIHEANTLRLSLYWPQKPWVPGLRALMRTLAPLSQDARSRTLLAAGYLPFRRQLALAMQSHPATWPAFSDPRIRYAPRPEDDTTQPALPAGDDGTPTFAPPGEPPPVVPDDWRDNTAGSGSPGQVDTDDHPDGPDGPGDADQAPVSPEDGCLP